MTAQQRTIILCKGLPGSGKTTWAKEQLKTSPERYKRVNRDELRQMIDDGVWGKERERGIREAEQALAKLYLERGYDVIIDDTNLARSQLEMWDDFAVQQHTKVIFQDFTEVPLEECIARDQKRANYVGEKVIRRMWHDHLQPKPVVAERIPDVPYVILCDLDGTLALIGDRSPYDAARCEEDTLNAPVGDIIRTFFDDGVETILMSGRSEEHRPQTERWLIRYGIHYQALYMRAAGDNRKDAIVKHELYDAHIAGKYNVLFVLDDRTSVVQLWRSLGLKCFQVADGDF